MEKKIEIRLNGNDELGYVKKATTVIKRNGTETVVVSGSVHGIGLLGGASEDASYGFDPSSPVLIGGGFKDGPKNSYKYMDSLRGPEGQLAYYHRVRSCCPFPLENGVEVKFGLLDVYRISWSGCKNPLDIYVNMHHTGKIKVPKGLTSKVNF